MAQSSTKRSVVGLAIAGLLLGAAQRASAQAPQSTDPTHSKEKSTATILTQVEPPRLVSNSNIPYPDGAAANAVVMLKLLITEEGKVKEVVVLDGGSPFSDVAVKEAPKWNFTPARVDGVPSSAYINFSVEFIAPVEAVPEPKQPPTESASVDSPQPSSEEESEIVVHGSRVPGTTRVMSDAESSIIPGAEGDPLRAIEAMPGTVPILASGPFIGLRGSSPGMVGYQFDGISVPYLFHLARGTAVINPWLVESAAIYGTGGPARLGRADGGTVEGRAAAPENRKRVQARVRLTDSSVGVELPFLNGKGNLMAAGRYSYTKLMVSLIAPEFSLNYWDYQLRLRYQLTPHDQVEILSFGAGDHSSQAAEDGSVQDLMNGSFHRASLRYVHDGRDGAKQRISLTYGHDRWDGKPAPIRPRSHALTLKYESDTPILGDDGSRLANIQYGADAGLRFQKDDYYTEVNSQAASTYHRNDFSAATWLDWSYYASSRTTLDLGVRADLFASSSSPLTKQAVGWSIVPRFALSHKLAPILRLHSSFGLNSQLRSPAQRPPGRMLTPNGGLELGMLSDFGTEFDLPAGFSADTTVFHNIFLNVMDAEQLQFLEQQALDNRANGQVYGFEFALKRMLAKNLRGFIAYTFSHSTRSIGRAKSAAAYDRRHVLDAALAYDFGKGWNLSSRATYYTGYQARMQNVAELQSAPRSTPYFQLDVQGAKRFKIDEYGRYWAITLGVLNATLSSDTDDFSCSQGSCVEHRVGPATIPTIGVEGEL